MTAQYKDIDTHPPHVLSSELYIIHILADCFSAHWSSLNSSDSDASENGQHSLSEGVSHIPQGSRQADSQHGSDETREIKVALIHRLVAPKPLDDILVGRILEAIKLFLAPYSDQYVLPASTILGDENCGSRRDLVCQFTHPKQNGASNSDSAGSSIFDQAFHDIEVHARTIVEFLSASNWALIFEHVKTSLRLLQIVFPLQGNGVQTTPVMDDDRNALATLRIVAFLWVDSRKLSLVLSELCGSFFHLRKSFQNTLALVLPTLVMRWIEQNPEEFVQMHHSHSRIDGGVDRLFDIANGMVDNGRWRAVLYPFQMSLLFLIPDVFEVATSMPSAGRYIENGGLPKAGSPIFKKVAFLETLRKALRNKNSAAAYCLVSLLRTARHFSLESSDSALLSYALDVQDDVREALFRKNASGNEPVIFDDGLMTAAFVSLVHLNFETCNETIAPLCLASNAPGDFKLAFISACSHLARQPSTTSYAPLFKKISALIRAHLKVLFFFTLMVALAN